MPSRVRRGRLARQLGGPVDDHLAYGGQWAAHEDYGATIPAEIADAIDNAYRSLGTDVAVAVRSSRERPRMQVTAHSPD